MALYSVIQISGVTLSHIFEDISVRKNISYSADSFEAHTFNTAGSRATYFNVGDNVKIYHDTGSRALSGLNQIFFGRIEYIRPESNPNDEKMVVGGRDFTNALMDVTVQALYISGTSNTCEAGSIVRDLVWISDYSGTITVSNVGSVVAVLQNYRVRNNNLFDAIKGVADIVGYDFWVDYNKDLHFQPANATSTGFTFDNTNVLDASFEKNTNQMFNKIRVYGDKTFVGQKETFTADGAGSVFTVLYGPNSPTVQVSGTVKQGGVLNQNTFLQTGLQYLVDFDNKKIVFISGTSVGVNTPGSLVQVIVEYGRSVPIVKEARDDLSIATNGEREQVITNTEIKDPNQAIAIAKAQLLISKNPAVDGNIKIFSSTISGVQPGQTAVVMLPNDNVSGLTLKVFETNYDINQTTMLENRSISMRVGTRIQDTSDLLKNLVLTTRALQAADTDVTDIITRLSQSVGSIGTRGHWYVKTRTDMGSSFIINDSIGLYPVSRHNRALYRLNSSGTVQLDAGAFGNNGSVNGTLLLTSGHFGGYIGSSSNFIAGSNSYVKVLNNNSGLNFSGTTYTLAAWVNSVTLNGSIREMVSLNPLATSPFFKHFELADRGDGTVRFGVCSGTTRVLAVTGSPTMTTGSWFRFVGVYDAGTTGVNGTGSTVVLYKNNAVVASASGTLPSLGSATGSGLYIGGTDVLGRYFDGRIESVEIYDYPWGSADVTSDFNSGSGRFAVGSYYQSTLGVLGNVLEWAASGLSSGLKCYYRFRNGALTNGLDATNNIFVNEGGSLAAGITGSGYLFAGSPTRMVTTGSYGVLVNNVGPFTVSLWARPPATLDSGAYIKIGLTDAGGGGGLGIGIGSITMSTTGSNLCLVFETQRHIATNSPLTLDAWNHIVVNVDVTGSSANTYLNNVYLGSFVGVRISGIGGNGSTAIGGYGTRWQHGTVSDVGIWDRTLSLNEIGSLYNKGRGLTSLQAYLGDSRGALATVESGGDWSF